MSEIDTANEFMVGMQNGKLVVLLPPRILTKNQALLFAAWLVALADDDDKFPSILEAVQNT